MIPYVAVSNKLSFALSAGYADGPLEKSAVSTTENQWALGHKWWVFAQGLCLYLLLAAVN